MNAVCRATLLAACLFSVSCQRKSAEKETPPFRIIATDAGFEAPRGVAAGLRHVIFENRGSEIHEAMLVKLAKGMTANDYMAAVKAGSRPSLCSSNQKPLRMSVRLDRSNFGSRRATRRSP